MVKYFCNRCNKEIIKSDVIKMRIDYPNGSVGLYHYCRECSAALKSFLTTTVEPLPDDIESKDSSEDDNDCTNEDGFQNSKPSFTLILDDGRDLRTVQQQQAFMDLSPIRLADMQAYLQPEKPVRHSSRSYVDRAVRAVLMFYCGEPLFDIRKKLGMQIANLNSALCGHVSAGTYARWFGVIPKFEDQDGNNIDPSQVIALVKSGMRISYVKEECGACSEDAIFDVIEFFIGFKLDDVSRLRWLRSDGSK